MNLKQCLCALAFNSGIVQQQCICGSGDSLLWLKSFFADCANMLLECYETEGLGYKTAQTAQQKINALYETRVW
jgi:hypothetical protein